MEEAVCVDHFRGGLRHAEVSAHDVASALQDLSVGGDLHLDARKRPAHRAELVLAGEVHARHRDGLGEPVPLEHVEPDQVEEVGNLARERRSTGNEGVDPPPEAFEELLADLREDELLRERERKRRMRPAFVLGLGVRLELRHRQPEQPPCEPALRPPPRDDVVERLLVDARNRGKDRGARLRRVVDQPVHRLGEDHGQTATQPGGLDDLGEGVGEGQEQ